jgi:hypothetical protein
VRLLVEPAEPGLGHDRDERMRIELGVRDAQHQVDRAGTEGRQAHAGLPGERPVRVGHERGASLVARGHEPDRRIDQRVDHVEVLLAGEPEDILDALVLEAGDQQLRDVPLARGRHPGQPIGRRVPHRRLRGVVLGPRCIPSACGSPAGLNDTRAADQVISIIFSRTA